MWLAVSWLLALPLASACGPSAAPVCTPVEKWSWPGRPQPIAESPLVLMTPLVLQLTDDDGDGRVDGNDRPDVAIVDAESRGNTPQGFLTVLDGETGARHFANASVSLDPTALAAADIDGDGVVELLAIGWRGGQVHAFDHGGALRWTSLPAEVYPGDTLAVADLDQDGTPEVLAGATVLDAAGTVLWSASRSRGVPGGGNGLRFASVAELAPTPGLEVLAGHTLYDAAGGVVWDAAAPDGYTAVEDLDGDGLPEIALTTETEVVLLDAGGNVLAPPHAMPWSGIEWLSPPAAADIDGDGVAELIAIQGNQMQALEWTAGSLSVKWSLPVADPSRLNGASFYDFNADGAAEVLYHDHVLWFVIDGRSGAPLSRIPFPSGTFAEYPVIAEIDRDCDPEILVTGGFDGGPPLIAYDCGPAAPPRGIWNQYAYHATNIEDDGRVPRVEVAPWTVRGGWHQQSWDPRRAAPVCPGLCVLPPAVTGLTAIKRSRDVALAWDTPSPGAGFNVWYQTSKLLIDEARLGGTPAPVGVAGCSPPGPASGGACADAGAVVRPPELFFYQVRGCCDARTEGP